MDNHFPYCDDETTDLCHHCNAPADYECDTCKMPLCDLCECPECGFDDEEDE